MQRPYSRREMTLLNFFFGQVRGIILYTLLHLNLGFWALSFYPIAFVRLLVPVKSVRRSCYQLLSGIAENFFAVNNFFIRHIHHIRYDIQGVENLKRDGWYLVLSNHQSWADIFLLEAALLGRIPLMKYFVKDVLFWYPILGFAFWALDFPFMKRYSKKFLEKHPHLKGKDLEATKKACEKLKTLPTSIMNFAEGTRFTPEKKRNQPSPYTHLLRPRGGGVSLVLAALSGKVKSIIDVTIVYPQGAPGLWPYLCGEVDEVFVRVKEIPVGPELIGDYDADEVFREHFREWINTLWAEKDRTISELLARQAGSRPPTNKSA